MHRWRWNLLSRVRPVRKTAKMQDSCAPKMPGISRFAREKLLPWDYLLITRAG